MLLAFCSLSASIICSAFYILFFFNDTATTEIYTLSLHDALPICCRRYSIGNSRGYRKRGATRDYRERWAISGEDRKSTRLNSSHLGISYAVFCLKKKKSYNTIS